MSAILDSAGRCVNPVHQYEPHDAPDTMKRDGIIALAVILAACLGVGTACVWGATLVRRVIAW
jgi:hypothetical protein